jgi:histidinol phosphatase-like PHP family hydrolase
VRVLYGFEVSIFDDGRIDLPVGLAEEAALVIASRRPAAPGAQQDGEVITRAFEKACASPLGHVIGHGPRHLESRRDVDWRRVFAAAAHSGTAIEVNVQSFPEPHREPARMLFWADWLKVLERSGADVFLGEGMHNTWQCERFIMDMLRLGATHAGAPNDLVECLRAVARAGIAPERVVTSSWPRFSAWLRLDKRERAHVTTAQLGMPA